MSFLSGFRGAVDASDELRSLRHQIAALQRALKKRGRAGWNAAEEEGAEIYDELRERLSEALPVVQRQAQAAGRFARDNSGAIVVTAAVVGLLVALAMRRR